MTTIAALAPLRSRAWARVKRSHTRYTEANGDALAGALTYALLISTAPFVALAALALGGLGISSRQMASVAHRAAGVVLPDNVAAAVDSVQPGPGLRIALIGAMFWGSMRLIRALRTGIRATCGQPAGSGNVFRDAARDALLGVALLAAMAVAAAVTAFAAAGSWWGPLVSLPVVALLIAWATVRCAWRGTGRPTWPAALRAATAAAVLLHVLTIAAGPYFAATADLHAVVYRSAGAIIGVLVWCNLAARIVFRAAAWASTATPATEQAQRPGDLWVVVPALNEAASIKATLEALDAQTDKDFTLVVVDNGSTDGTPEIVKAAGVQLLTEPRPGPGTAVDTGFRHAIANGATYLTRTDADCVPAPDWVATARSVLAGGAEMACGRSVPRPDESPSWAERRLFPAAVRLAAVYGRYAQRGRQYRTPYVLCHGHNIAITADLYQRCGGATDTTLLDGSEDVELLNRARRHSDRVVRAENLVVYNSLRRLRSWGPRRTLLWYWDRRYRPEDEAATHVRVTA